MGLQRRWLWLAYGGLGSLLAILLLVDLHLFGQTSIVQSLGLVTLEERQSFLHDFIANNQDVRISQSLFRAWGRGDVWIVEERLMGGETYRYEELGSQEAWRRYKHRPREGEQIVITLDPNLIRRAASSDAEADALAEVLVHCSAKVIRAAVLQR